MKKTEKRSLLAVFCAILFALTVFLSACKEIAVIDENCYVNRSVRLDFSESDYEELTGSISQLQSALENENVSETRFGVLSLKMNLLFSDLIDSVSIAKVYYYSDLTNTETYDVYNDLYSKYNVVFNEYKKLFEPAYHSRYKELFYGDMSDEEIEETIAGMVVSDELVALNGRQNDLEAEYNSFTDEQIMGEAYDELYAELIDTENAIAKCNGYENYMEYCYPEVYGRDYTPAKTLQFAEALKENILAAASVAGARSKSAITDGSLNQTDIAAYLNVENGSFETKENQALLDGFYRSMGDEIYSVYKQFLKNGYYFIARGENAYEGAFTGYLSKKGAPYIYFSESYATPMTFVHEFGHYCNMYFCGGNTESYELAETHSQGAESMFVAYLKNTLSANAYSYLVNSYFYGNSAQLFLFSIVGAFEIDVFSADRTAENFSFDGEINAITENYIGLETYRTIFSGYTLPSTYYRYVVVNSSGYYISYAVSLVSAMQFYVLAQTDYTAAAESYRNLLNYSDEYQNALQEVGLASPFASETFAALAKAFTGIENEVTE